MTLSPAVRTVTLLLASAFALAGCRAAVETGFVVQEDLAVTVDVTVELDAVAAQAFSEDDLAALSAALEGRAGSEAVIRRDADGVRISASLTYSALRASSAMTGVADARLEQVDASTAVLTVELVEPVDLLAVITAAAARQPDADALLVAMLHLTEVTVSVRFPGPVTQVFAPSGVAPSSSDGTVQVVQPLDRFISGTLTVAGSLLTEKEWPAWPFVSAGSVFILAALVWRLRSRR